MNLDSSFKEIYINFIQQERRWAKTEEELELAVQRISVLEDEKKTLQGIQWFNKIHKKWRPDHKAVHQPIINWLQGTHTFTETRKN